MRRLLWIAGALAVVATSLWVGGRLGWRLYDEALSHGCVQLPADVVPLELQAATPGHVRFAALGDTGTASPQQHAVAEALREVCEREGCDFVALLGDNFYPDGVRAADDVLFDTAFEAVYADLQRPVLAILGNHDVHLPPLWQPLHSRTSRLWRMPNYEYAFQVGAARFFAINTNCQPLAWWRLEERLAEPFDGWTFVLGHHPVYSEGPHGDGNWAIQWYWRELAPRVDYLLGGHNHLLEHLQREGERTDYVISGSGGAAGADPAHAQRPSAATLRFQNYAAGFAWFDVEPQQVRWRFYDEDGRVLYEQTRAR